MGTILLYGTNLAVNLRLNMGTILLYGTNLAVNTFLAFNLRPNFCFAIINIFQTVLSANFFSFLLQNYPLSKVRIKSSKKH